jgi:hypothetical protein
VSTDVFNSRYMNQSPAEIEEQARRAVKSFRSLQPTLTSYARQITGRRRLQVVCDTSTDSNATNGTHIFIRPPLALGDNEPHISRLCGERDKLTKKPLCAACDVRESVLVMIYHEIAHIAHNSFENVTDYDKKNALELALKESGSAYAKQVKKKIDAEFWANKSYLDLAGEISKWLPMILNGLEDARVNNELFKSRKGLKVMFEAFAKSTFEEGVEQVRDGKMVKLPWREYDVNAQAIIGTYVVASGYTGYKHWFVPEVVEALKDEQLRALLNRMKNMRSAKGTYTLSVEVLERLRELGFCKLPEEKEPEPEEMPPPPVPQPGDNTDEQEPGESGEQGGESQEGGSGGSGSSQPDAGDSSESSDQNDDSDASDSGEPDTRSGGTSGEEEPEEGDSEDGDRSDSGSGDSDDDGVDDESSTDESADASDSGSRSGDSDESGEQGSDPDEGDEGLPEGSPDPSGAGEELDDERGDDASSDADEADQAESDADGGEDSQVRGDSDDLDSEDSSGSEDSGLGEGTETSVPERGHDDHSDERGDEGSDNSDDEDVPDSESGTDDDMGSGGDDSESGDPESASSEGESGDDSEGEREEDVADGTGEGSSSSAGGFGEDSGQEDGPVELDDPNEAQSAIDKVLGHIKPDEARQKLEDLAEKVIDMAVMQGLHFDAPSREVAEVRIHKHEVQSKRKLSRGHGWWNKEFSVKKEWREYAGIDGDFDPSESVLGPALLQMRVAFQANARARKQLNLKKGKLSAKALGKRAWGDDPRLFQKKTLPGKRNYFVLIGIDISGSTTGENIKLAKRAAMAQAELCSRVGIDFAVYAHSGDLAEGYQKGDEDGRLALDIYVVKDQHDPWDNKAKDRLRGLCSDLANLDGHTIEFYRKILDKVDATDKIIMYYSDGAMPMENYHEELMVLTREIKICKQRGYTLMGVGIRTDAPKAHGLDTVEVFEDSDIVKVVKHLEKRLMEKKV